MLEIIQRRNEIFLRKGGENENQTLNVWAESNKSTTNVRRKSETIVVHCIIWGEEREQGNKRSAYTEASGLHFLCRFGFSFLLLSSVSATRAVYKLCHQFIWDRVWARQITPIYTIVWPGSMHVESRVRGDLGFFTPGHIEIDSWIL